MEDFSFKPTVLAVIYKHNIIMLREVNDVLNSIITNDNLLWFKVNTYVHLAKKKKKVNVQAKILWEGLPLAIIRKY
jgi:hypothetical protein